MRLHLSTSLAQLTAFHHTGVALSLSLMSFQVMEILLSQHNPDLYYQHGPILMQAVPKPFVDALIQESRRLSPVKLIPSLVVSSKKDQVSH